LYQILDQLFKAKDQIELALYRRLRDLFSFKPDLVLYDITSTYFEGAGPADFAKHGYSRDAKPQNVQVIVGVVMVAGWPIAHHVWEGNRLDHSTVQEVISDLRKRFAFGRLVFVGDRGMVTDANIESIKNDGDGYIVGIKRRRNAKLDT
jgi:transposase